ncbi:hypothetical protein E5Q_06051 [Mixia osmundae IAM 14324]|uniref:Pre-mRNA processing factor 4 (PRP4)-like domain-containing protein n=1 Tax=Mixia osmundae (strain CBS 9802 / IAM 14324 / JCM 22182 / KY 12970) TaxID=764103 RepID=G7E9N7_MIXOS|nr:hypothetical protein E5Q_06051 [Mixia osmundae IAM 14324]
MASGSGAIDLADLEEASASTSAALHPETNRLLAELERKTQARKLAIPTNDVDVRARLRELGEPITLFGEKREDRRDRLRTVVSEAAAKRGETFDASESDSSDSDDSDKQEEFYTEGSQALLRARSAMAQHSLQRARKRLARQRLEASIPLGRILDRRKQIYAELKSYTILGSQLADERPISATRFSPNSAYLASGSWSGAAKIWSVPGCRCLGHYRGHAEERVGDVQWHPQATLSQSEGALNFATSGGDGNICLWSLDGLDSKGKGAAPIVNINPLSTLTGHSARICRMSFHPTGSYLASASFDETWRLWDVEKGTCLLEQEGHSKAVYAIDFQGDGALICTGGLDAIGRVWDTRSGKTAMVLDGHVRDILAINWAPNGHQIATGSNDDTVRIWDIRSLRSIYTIPAHKSAISDVKFFHSTVPSFPMTIKTDEPAKPNGHANGNGKEMDAIKKEEDDGERDRKMLIEQDEVREIVEPPLSGVFLASGAYDGFVRIWSADDWQLIKAVSSESGGKVMSIDLSGDGKYLASGEYNRWDHALP